MADRILHPDTGLHYLHIFPDQKVFCEIEACYRMTSNRLKWMSVDRLGSWSEANPGWHDSSLLLIFWGSLPRIPAARTARIAHRFTESVGPLEGLIDNQRKMICSFLERAKEADLILVGSPAVLEFLKPHCRNVCLYPIGYEPDVMGEPDCSRLKIYDLGFHGTMVGRRKTIVPMLQARIGMSFIRIEKFESHRKEAMELCRADLHIGHSIEPSFPGMRLWQAIATSAALITENRDAWPAVDGLHYVGVPHFQESDPAAFFENLQMALNLPLREISARAHGDLERYRVEYCMTTYLVPASSRIQNS